MTSAIPQKIPERLPTDREPSIAISSDTFTVAKESVAENKEFMQSSVSSYSLANDTSIISRDVDRWIHGGTVSNENTIPNRLPNQRSMLTRSSSLDRSGLWYLIAMFLPIFSISSNPAWNYNANILLDTASFFVTRFYHACGRATSHVRRLAQDQMARELFATAMDIVLVIYAVGFLILSMYQASIFG